MVFNSFLFLFVLFFRLSFLSSQLFVPFLLQASSEHLDAENNTLNTEKLHSKCWEITP